MSFVGHVITLILLLFVTSEIGWMSASQASIQHLPGSSMATLPPILVLCLYLIGVVIENLKRKPKRHWFVIWVLIIMFMIYPAVICEVFGS